MVKVSTGLIFWLVPSENRADGKDQAQALYNLRHSLWHKCRYIHRLVPLDNSVYLIQDPSKMQSVKEMAAEFLKKYEVLGFRAIIDIAEYEREQQDLKQMLEIAFMQVLSSKVSAFEQAEGKGKTVAKNTVRKSEADIAWVQDDLKKFEIKSDRIQAFIEILQEKIKAHLERLQAADSETTVTTEWTVS